MTATQRPLALITGASAGIGAEFARQMAAAGYDLALTARRTDRLDEMASELRERHGVQCLTIGADLADPDGPRSIHQALRDADRRVGVLVNNAGYGLPGHYHSTEWQDQARFLQVMVTAVAELTHRLLPEIREDGYGGIINVASLAGLVPGASGQTLYAASKAFMIRFTESLAMENDDTHLSFQALCPGFTYSEFHDVTGTRDLVSQMPERMWMHAAEVAAISLRRFGRRRAPIVVVPGRWNRFLATLARKLPRRMAFNMVKRKAGAFRPKK